MKQLVTEGIVLSRTDFGEADRILTLLTPHHGKLRLMAKGVRRVKSKLAGGIELFSVSNITFVQGRGEISTLVSTRLVKYYGHIVQDLDRTMLGYELIKQLNKATEDHPEPAYFDLLEQTFEALDALDISPSLVRFWFATQQLRIAGHTPNLQTDRDGKKLLQEALYDFDFDQACFLRAEQGRFGAPHIKFLRLSFSDYSPKVLAQVRGQAELLSNLEPLVQMMLKRYVGDLS